MKFLFSSIIFTLSALTLVTTSVVQSLPQIARIVGGSQSTEGDFPYFVEMGRCGGALIAPDAVLFAAHCSNYTGQQVIVGSYERRKLNYGAEERICEEWKAHPLYARGSDIDNDFALCKLNKPVILSSTVTLVLNDDSMVPAEDDDLIVMGLGALAEEGAFPDFIHDVSVRAISNAECNASPMYDNQITDDMLCAGFREGRKDSCQGDSGGPIVKRVYQDDGTIVDYHVGVVSWGSGCADANKPGVYARTSSATSFIKDTVCNEFNSVASFCDNLPTPPTSCDVELDVKVTTDVYGFETSWSIKENVYDDEITIRKYLISNYDNDHKVCIEKDKCYTFEINDSHGDGLCSTNNKCGSYSLSMPGKEPFATGGRFKFNEKKSFCILGNGEMDSNAAPTKAPTAAPREVPPTKAPTVAPVVKCNEIGEMQFMLNLQIDDFGGETTWDLSEHFPQSDETGDIIARDNKPENYLETLTYTIPSCLKQNTCYKFGIYDSFGDGIQASNPGYFKGFVNGEQIFEGGDFKSDDFRTFCVAALSQNEDISDCDNDAKFFYNGDPKKGCKWVGRGNKRQIKRKCKKKDKKKKKKLSEYCPETCGRKGIGKCKSLKKKRSIKASSVDV